MLEKVYIASEKEILYITKHLNTNPDICIRKQYLIIFKFTENKVCFNVMT